MSGALASPGPFRPEVRSVPECPSAACRCYSRGMSKRRVHNENQIEGDVAGRQEGFGPESERDGGGAKTAGQSGDLQGLSTVADADSESVDELLEEGQSLEAAIVSGVEDAPEADQGPVRTHEVLEDDVPEEYDPERP